MASLQIDNVPDEVMTELHHRAQQSHRRIEDEAISILTNAVSQGHDLTAAELLDRARRLREGHPSAWVTEDFLRAAKDNGRA